MPRPLRIAAPSVVMVSAAERLEEPRARLVLLGELAQALRATLAAPASHEIPDVRNPPSGRGWPPPSRPSSRSSTRRVRGSTATASRARAALRCRRLAHGLLTNFPGWGNIGWDEQGTKVANSRTNRDISGWTGTSQYWPCGIPASAPSFNSRAKSRSCAILLTPCSRTFPQPESCRSCRPRPAAYPAAHAHRCSRSFRSCCGRVVHSRRGRACRP